MVPGRIFNRAESSCESEAMDRLTQLPCHSGHCEILPQPLPEPCLFKFNRTLWGVLTIRFGFYVCRAQYARDAALNPVHVQITRPRGARLSPAQQLILCEPMDKKTVQLSSTGMKPHGSNIGSCTA